MMLPYTEAQLQAYVERHLERDFQKWIGSVPFSNVRFLGAQVHCANGIIDVLGTANSRPLVIELKAVPVTEKVVGQVSRYRNAVRETFAGLCFDICMNQSRMDVRDLRGEEGITCVVIAPSYDHNCLSSLGHFGWPLVAEMDDAGVFTIYPQNISRRHSYGQGSPQVYEKLVTAAFEHVGACVAKTWRTNWEDAENKKRNPFHYHISEA
jgi:hypothetical protein